MKIQANRKEGYQLLHDGLIELALVEANGLRIDVGRMEQSKSLLEAKPREIRAELQASEVWKVWKKRFGADANLTSREQLGKILFEDLKFKSKNKTATGKFSTSDEDLADVDHPFVQRYREVGKLKKALDTLKGIQKEVVGDRLHPSFNLHTVQSYRGSCNDPNFQNLQVRDKEMAELIRSFFIPSPGSVIVENDFKGVEVSVSACAHKDPNFISYITTPGKDMHRDMAAQIYKMKPEEVSKDARYGAKNKFVFPQFYGDYYKQCAENLWDWMIKGNLKGPDGKIPLMDYLKSKGICGLGACDPEKDALKGTFERHLQDIENDFWNNRFKHYGKWRRDFYNEYLRKGYFDLFTGFRIYGAYDRKKVCNYVIQGPAFHCLLWTLIQVNRKLRKYKMKSMIVGQIHDSLIGDVVIKELTDYLSIVEETVTVELRKFYQWLIVPLEVEYEIAPSNGTWFQKREVKFSKGWFLHPEKKHKLTQDPEKFIARLDQLNKNPRT